MTILDPELVGKNVFDQGCIREHTPGASKCAIGACLDFEAVTCVVLELS